MTTEPPERDTAEPKPETEPPDVAEGAPRNGDQATPLEAQRRILNEIESERIAAYRDRQSAQERRNRLMTRFGQQIEELSTIQGKLEAVSDNLERWEDALSPKRLDERRREAHERVREELAEDDIDLSDWDLGLPNFSDAVTECQELIDSKAQELQDRRQSAQQAIQEAEQEVGKRDDEWRMEERRARAKGMDLSEYWDPDTDPLPEEEPEEAQEEPQDAPEAEQEEHW